METNRTAPPDAEAPRDEQGERTTDGRGTGGGAGGSAPNGGPGSGFFADLRRAGVPRREGWIGGVCAGVAARIGLDPIIVRGIVVVLAVLGAPFLLIYAAAWLLLPDLEGRIHLEQLFRGVVDPALAGIAVLTVVGIIPLVQGGWLGWRWWPDLPALPDPLFGVDLSVPLRLFWVLLLLGGLAALVVWLVRRASATGGVDAPAQAAPAQSAPAETGTGSAVASEASASAATAAFAGEAPPAPAPPPAPPLEPSPDASGEELGAWRQSHDAWRAEHAEWRAGQAEADRRARAAAAEENRAQARELMARADAARAARRASRPRASAAFVFTALGLAIVGGAVAAIAAMSSTNTDGFAVPLSLATAVCVFAAAMVIAALRRRRSGWLAFFASATTLVMLAATAIAATLPSGRLIGPNASISLASSQRLVQPVGDAYLSLYTPLGAPASAPVVELSQGIGQAWVSIDENDRLLLDTAGAGGLSIWVTNGQGELVTLGPDTSGGPIVVGGPDGVADDDAPIDAKLVLRQWTGAVYVEIRSEMQG
ncbi:PspC domain-containing protein [Agromyces soli]|uniref:PspC domain-containing protein n=1 Tax=Agromyces soli TaxID=659012 RepID=A0ABY4B0J1_9MICO|nr:PspC domain-containing protein [Agromyces soli]UOE26535.1 PspC domain-containing protein [Agromyces soli]